MDASPVAPGQILAGKYRIERVLGEGGMGVVVEAHDTSLERRVAIKFLLPDFVKHVEAKERFLREARAAVKIQSEHVARVIDVSTLEGGAPYMVMEFLEGSDLSRVIETGGPLSVEDAALYVIQACEALAEAHAHGIIHRDLKPANLFLAQQAGGSRKIKVLDFGISKTNSADAKASGSLTRTSSMMGSPLYMSPEQMKSARDVDLRTDIWALGVILYEALTGNPPFLGNSIPEISAKILLEDPRPVFEARPNVPKLLSDVTARALQKQPEKRFSNVGELAIALLPFAPSRARNNVERITRVLEDAGFAKSDFLASVPPPPQAMEPASNNRGPVEAVPQPSVALAEGGAKRKGATLANWGQTQMEAAKGSARSSRLLLGAALGSVAALAAVVGLVVHFSAGSAPAAAATASAAAPPPPAAPAPPVQAATAPKVAVISAAESAARAVETPEPVQDEAKEPAAPAAQPKLGTGAKKPRSPAPAAVHTASASAVVKPKEKSYTSDFKSKFGSRK